MHSQLFDYLQTFFYFKQHSQRSEVYFALRWTSLACLHLSYQLTNGSMGNTVAGLTPFDYDWSNKVWFWKWVDGTKFLSSCEL